MQIIQIEILNLSQLVAILVIKIRITNYLKFILKLLLENLFFILKKLAYVSKYTFQRSVL